MDFSSENSSGSTQIQNFYLSCNESKDISRRNESGRRSQEKSWHYRYVVDLKLKPASCPHTQFSIIFSYQINNIFSNHSLFIWKISSNSIFLIVIGS
ncbi:hypothetical protein L2E82_45532 [Cichorium intybus]|uniref:Uncharacterized protein n=1 Tax=Cichorium intybus TaxID=13427 RepID=A0ACB8ZTS6_CICIN|nr:hypothetical protein L2E82_45532 [Cichorium intybus]